MDDRLNEWQQLPSVIKVLTSYEMGHWLKRRQGRIAGETIDRVLEIIDKVGERFEVGDVDEFEMFTEIRQGVLALKGDQG